MVDDAHHMRRAQDVSLVGKHVGGGFTIKDVIGLFLIIIAGLTTFFALENKVDTNMSVLIGKLDVINIQLANDEEEDVFHLKHGHIATKNAVQQIDKDVGLIQRDIQSIDENYLEQKTATQEVKDDVRAAREDARRIREDSAETKDDVRGIKLQLDRLFDLLEDRNQ